MENEKDRPNPYELFKQLREFIDQQSQIDDLGKIKHIPYQKKRKKIQIHDCDAELIDKLLNEWCKMYFNKEPVDQAKRDYVVKVFKELKQMTIYEDWLPYIQSMCEWLKLSSKDPMTADLALFLLGYCWRNASKNE